VDIETLVLKHAELKGQLNTYAELFRVQTVATKESENNTAASLAAINTKLDNLLLREASRDGEAKGLKRTAIVISTAIATIISGIAAAVR
jgi:hypothetical protein